jgi:hypothetical protein
VFRFRGCNFLFCVFFFFFFFFSPFFSSCPALYGIIVVFVARAVAVAVATGVFRLRWSRGLSVVADLVLRTKCLLWLVVVAEIVMFV